MNIFLISKFDNTLNEPDKIHIGYKKSFKEAEQYVKNNISYYHEEYMDSDENHLYEGEETTYIISTVEELISNSPYVVGVFR